MSGLERLRGAAQALTQTCTHSEDWAGMALHAGKVINDERRAGFAVAAGISPRVSSTSAASSSSTLIAGCSAPSRNSSVHSLCSTDISSSAASDDGFPGEFAGELFSLGLLAPAETPQAWTRQTMDWDDALARTLAQTRHVVALVHGNDASGGQTVQGAVEVAGVAGEGAAGLADAADTHAADRHCRCFLANKREEAHDEERYGWRCKKFGESGFMSQLNSEEMKENPRAHAIWVKRKDVARQTEESCLIGGCYLGSGEYGSAVRHLCKYKALTNASRQTRACVHLGSCYYELGETEKALATYEDAAAMSQVLEEEEKLQFSGSIRKGVGLCLARLAKEAAAKLEERVHQANWNAERLLQELEEEHAGAATKAACKKRRSKKKRAAAAGQVAAAAPVAAAAAPVIAAAPHLAAELPRRHQGRAAAAVAEGERFIPEEEGQAEEDAAEPRAREETRCQSASAQAKGGRAASFSSSSSSSSAHASCEKAVKGGLTGTLLAGSGAQVLAPDVGNVAAALPQTSTCLWGPTQGVGAGGVAIANPDSALRAAVPVADEQECCVCMATQKSSVFVPCGHMCVCAACATGIMARNKECPVCRRVSTLCIKVYS